MKHWCASNWGHFNFTSLLRLLRSKEIIKREKARHESENVDKQLQESLKTCYPQVKTLASHYDTIPLSSATDPAAAAVVFFLFLTGSLGPCLTIGLALVGR